MTSDWLTHALILAAVGVLLATNAAILVLRLGARSLRLIWLVALSGAALAWPLIVAARLGVPFQLVLINWQNALGTTQAGGTMIAPAVALFNSSPLILLDQISWSLAFALSTLLLGVFLTAVARAPVMDWRPWSASLALASLGLVAIIAGNPLTVLLAWAAFDLVEILIWLANVNDNLQSRNIIVLFGIRTLGLMILLGAILLATYDGEVLSFEVIPANISPLLLLAAGVRLGVIPLQVPFHSEVPVRQGLGTILRLAPWAVNVLLLTRIASAGIQGVWLTVFLMLALSVAFISVVAWIQATDELSGSPYWLMVTGSMALVAAVLGQPEACLAWGVTGILTGGFLFLCSIRHRYLIILTIGAALALTMLPFSPIWLNSLVYSAIWMRLPAWAAIAVVGIYLCIHALLVFGFMVHGLRIPIDQPEPERWIWLLYPPGLVVILLANFAWGWIYQPALGSLTLWHWLTGPVVCLLCAGIWIWRQRRPGDLSRQNLDSIWRNGFLRQYFSFSRAGQLLQRIFRFGNNVFRVGNATLEGEGGLLWAFLILIIFFSLAVQSSQVR